MRVERARVREEEEEGGGGLKFVIVCERVRHKQLSNKFLNSDRR